MPAAYKTALQKLRREAGYKSAAAFADHTSRNFAYLWRNFTHANSCMAQFGAKKIYSRLGNFSHFPIAFLFLFGYKLTNG